MMFIWLALNKMKISRVNEYHGIQRRVFFFRSRYIKKIRILIIYPFLLFDVLVKLCLRIDADVLLSCRLKNQQGIQKFSRFFYREEE